MQIVPINKLKDTAQMSEMCHCSQEPIFITKNGYGDMVIMSLEAYEKQQELFMLQKLRNNLDITKAVDGDAVMQRIKENYVK